MTEPTKDPSGEPAIDLDEPWDGGGPSLDTSGHLTGTGAPPPHPTRVPEVEPPLELLERPRVPKVRSPTHELSEQPAHAPNKPGPPSEPPRVTQPPAREKRPFPALAVMALLLAAALGAGLWVFRARPRPVEARQTPVLFIDSEPPGATIRIDGQLIGTTPLARENLYAPKDIDFGLTLNGYRPHAGTFRGAQTVRLNVPLKKK